MPSSVDYAYLERRYRESLERAEKAADPSIAKVHHGFAETYARAMAAEYSASIAAQESSSPGVRVNLA